MVRLVGEICAGVGLMVRKKQSVCFNNTNNNNSHSFCVCAREKYLLSLPGGCQVKAEELALTDRSMLDTSPFRVFIVLFKSESDFSFFHFVPLCKLDSWITVGK